MKTAIVIQAGGTGTRLWPLSRNKSPKQFNALINEKSLLQNTFDRLSQQYPTEDIFISTNINFNEIVLKQIPELKSSNLILEPSKRDKTAAFGLITLTLKAKGYDTLLLIPSDDYIGDVPEFLRVLKTAEDACAANPDKLLLIGINPNYPATGYGYIEMSDPIGRFGRDIIFTVSSFKEKPDKETAEKFISDWRYLWNAGWFIFNTDFILNKYKEFVPETYKYLENCYKLDPYSKEFADEYSKCEASSFDVAIVEKLKEVIVLPASIGWSDVGSWKLIKDILSKNNHKENVLKGNVLAQDTKGSIVYSATNKLIAVLGVENLIVIDTEDALLITKIDRAQDVKKIVEKLPEKYL